MELIGKRVEVYFNLHKKVYSVRDKKTKLVIAHLNNIDLGDVIFKVSQSGRKRVLAEKRKNVHAFVEGTILGYSTLCSDMVGITYNPYKYDSFVIRGNEKAVYYAHTASMVVNNKIPSIKATI